jgi:putative heme iron utilization protein
MRAALKARHRQKATPSNELGGVIMKSTVVKRSIVVAGHKTSRACRASARGRAMTDDQRIEALEQALRECAEAALDRIEALEELLVECTEVLIARGGHGELVARIRHLFDEEPPASIRRRNAS